jgi:hypothetical protein
MHHNRPLATEKGEYVQTKKVVVVVVVVVMVVVVVVLVVMVGMVVLVGLVVEGLERKRKPRLKSNSAKERWLLKKEVRPPHTFHHYLQETWAQLPSSLGGTRQDFDANLGSALFNNITISTFCTKGSERL